MLTGRLEGILRSHHVRADQVRIDGPQLFDDQGRLLAVHDRGYWRAGEEHYTCLNLLGPLRVAGDDGGAAVNEVGADGVTVTDGMVRLFQGGKCVVYARLDEGTQCWLLNGHRNGVKSITDSAL